MGKNYSRNQKREQRNKNDFYQTPHCLTEEFAKAHILPYWKRPITISDFCCGKRAIQDALAKYRINISFSCDIEEGFDFFALIVDQSKAIFEYGIMNPPFRLFNKWVEHCFMV